MCGAIKKQKNFFSNSCAKNLAITNKNIISARLVKLCSAELLFIARQRETGGRKGAKMLWEDDIKKTGEKYAKNGVKNI